MTNSKESQHLSDSFKLHNIDLKKNNLKVGYETGIKVSKYKDAFSTFNISVYCTPNLQKVIGEELVVVDGQCDEKQHELLATLSDMTSFNVQQYDIEHATTNRDGMKWDNPDCIHSVDEAIKYINEFGFLPLFKNDTKTSFLIMRHNMWINVILNT